MYNHRWIPDRKIPADSIPPLVPDSAIEVLSKCNTPGEMWRKLHDYFTAGMRLVWTVEPRKQTARTYTTEDQFNEIDENGSLSGGDILPGFKLSLSELFALARAPPCAMGGGKQAATD